MPLTILHISTRLILGGSQENTVLSCEGQAELGHEVHLAFGPIFGPEGTLLDRASEFRTSDGRPIHCHEVPHLVRELNPIADPRCCFELKRLIQRIKPDIVHTHSSKAGVLGRWAAWNAKPRPAVIHTIHGPPFHTFLPAHKNAVYVAAEKFAAKRCHTIVSVADAMTEQFRERGIGRPEQYITVRSGMETRKFLEPAPGEDRASMRAELGLNETDFVIGTVARLAELKGHDDIIDALKDELPGRSDWKLLWVGDGWWADRLLGRLDELGLRDRVITTGLVPQLRVPAMMRAMDVLVHASYREGLPRTVPQALLCGVPVIANDVDGTREACIDPAYLGAHGGADVPESDATGILTRPGDTAALRAAVVRLADDPGLRTRLGTTGREQCAREFATETMVERLEEVYARAIERNR